MRARTSIEARLALLALAAMGAVAAVAADAVWSVSHVARGGAALANAQVVLSQQQDADMMHDALRSDVLSMVPATRPDPAALLTATVRDAEQLRRGLESNQTLLDGLHDAAVTHQFAVARADLKDYAALAQHVVALGASDPAAARRALPEFDRRFEVARLEMSKLTNLLRANAQRVQHESATSADSSKRRTAETAAAALALLLGLTYAVRRGVQASLREKAAAEHAVQQANAQLTSDAAREGFDSTLKDAFEMATTEPEAHAVVRRVVQEVVPEHRVELLLADNSRAHLEAVMTEPGGKAPGCGVLTPTDCIAVRRGRPAVFRDAEGIASCPKLVGRDADIGQAACSPVTFLGEGLGVLHVVTAPGEQFTDDVVRSLAVTAEQTGSRIGTLRAFSRSQLQASTDGLTGLLNRRTVEDRIGELQRSGTSLALAMCDLDHFKTINDTFGHEAGDRALRVFSAALRSVMRTHDLVARYGGEEFLLAMPGCEVATAAEVLARIRTELALTLGAGGAPSFTASFGLTLLRPDQPLDEGVRAADLALMQAKAAGRDRVVVAGDQLQRQA